MHGNVKKCCQRCRDHWEYLSQQKDEAEKSGDTELVEDYQEDLDQLINGCHQLACKQAAAEADAFSGS